MYFARHPDIIIRREHFGGIAFNTTNGKLVEFDREVCRLLELTDGRTDLQDLVKKIEDEFNIEIKPAGITRIIEFLRYNGFLTKNFISPSITYDYWPEKAINLSAPETVHLALMHRCNYHCPSCYIDDPNTPEMTTPEIKALIDELAEMKVFQLAIGGGEPFLREDLIEIVSYAYFHGIISNITTNGSFITPKIVRELSEYIGQIQLSLNGHDRKLHESSRQENSFEPVLKALKILRKQKMRFGINVLLCRENFESVEKIIEFSIESGASTINFLRPKPTCKNYLWYDKNSLSNEAYWLLSSILQKMLYDYPSIRITVDCAFSFLMSGVSPHFLQQHGVYGCSGAMRFVSIHPDGSVYPCSFLDYPTFYGGNVIKDGLKIIWHESFQKFRKNIVTGKCSLCKNKDFCRGCRAVAYYENEDIASDDPGCFIEY